MDERLQVEPSLVGREEELGRIEEALDAGAAGAFVIAGEAGVGKSRLGREVVGRAAARGATTATVVATRAAASIPFGPFASLLPAGAHAADRLALLREGVDAIGAMSREGSKLVLLVDDAHLLDDASAALTHLLVQAGVCSVVLTVRTPDPAPDPVTAIWKDGLAERIDLGALGEDDLAALVAESLGGPAARATVRRFLGLSDGNALYLRELLLGAATAGHLRQSRGLWTLADSFAPPARLLELIRGRLQELAPETAHAMQLVAVAEPLELTVLEQLAGAAAIEDAEERGLIRTLRDDRRLMVRLSHPLYGETIRQTLSTARLRRLGEAIATGLTEAGGRRRGDLLRIARLQLDGKSSAADPDLMLRAARRALEVFEPELAHRLAERSLDCGGGVEAGLVLGESLFSSGRAVKAETVLARLVERCTDDDELARVASARAHNLHNLLGDTAAADAVIEHALAAIGSEPARVRLLGRQATNRLMEGRPEEALRFAEPLLRSGDLTHVARGGFVAGMALGLLGRGDESVAAAEQGFEAKRSGAQTFQSEEAQLLGAVLGHVAAGRLAEADELATGCYERSTAAGDREGASSFLVLRGVARIEEGLLGMARDDFLESALIHRELNDVGGLRWCLGGLAVVAGMYGRGEEANDAIRELDGLPTGWMGFLEPDLVSRGRAWARVAAGELSAARAGLAEAATAARSTRQLLPEARLLHDIARLGDPVAVTDRLAEIAASAGGMLFPTLAAHASRLVRQSAPELEETGATLGAMGARVIAAEADLAAAELFRSQGLERRSTALVRRAGALVAGTGGAATPGLSAASATEHLTRREREIAGLAAAGLPSREIAGRLVLSVRTVDNHLRSIYLKLGISSRPELVEALGRP